jgi:hypothetical protein
MIHMNKLPLSLFLFSMLVGFIVSSPLKSSLSEQHESKLDNTNKIINNNNVENIHNRNNLNSLSDLKFKALIEDLLANYNIENNEDLAEDAEESPSFNQDYLQDGSSSSDADNDSNNDELVRFVSKKSAPRRIFIGKRDFITDYDPSEGSDAINYLLHPLSMSKRDNLRRLSLLNQGGQKRNGQIHRIFIGKRGDIKRIFIG